MTQHTPGPWQVFNGGALIGTVEDRDGSTYIADMRRTPEQDANARLIAAAPELLEALRRLASVREAGEEVDALEQARAAIAKAEGRQ